MPTTIIKQPPQVEKRTQKSLFIYIAAVFVVISFMVLYVWQRVQKDYLISEIQRLRREKTKQTREYFRLRVEVYELSSQKRIEGIATKRLNMHYPKLNQELITLKIGQVEEDEQKK